MVQRHWVLEKTPIKHIIFLVYVLTHALHLSFFCFEAFILKQNTYVPNDKCVKDRLCMFKSKI